MKFKNGDLAWLSYRHGDPYGLLRIGDRKKEGWNARDFLEPPVYYVTVVKTGEHGEAPEDILLELSALDRLTML